MIKTILITFFLSFKIFAFGELEEKRMQVEKDVQNKITAVLTRFEPESRVEVNVKMRKIRVKSVENAFLLAEIKPEANIKYRVSSIQLVIYSQVEESKFAKPIIDNITKIAAKFVNKKYISIKFEKINPLESTTTLMLKEAFNFLIKEKVLGWMVLLLFSIVFLFKFPSFMFHKYFHKRNQEYLTNIVSESIGQIREGLENISGHGDARSQGYGSSAMKFEISNDKDAFLEEYDNAALVEVLMDCYWAEEDEYAAYIWNKLNSKRRSNLLGENALLAEYATYLNDIEGVDKKYLSDIYYLNPLNLAKIDNINLGELVKENPEIFVKLPKMRMLYLRLSAKEKRELLSKKYTEQEIEKKILSLSWEKYFSVDERTFDSQIAFFFNSNEEESEFFLEKNLDFSLVNSFPALSWLRFLTDDQIKSIFANYSAKEMATIWIAPEPVLAYLEERLDQKKILLMKSYLEKQVPSRENSIFHSLMNEVSTIIDRKEKPELNLA